MHAVLSSQFDGSLPQRFRQLRPPRLTASKLLQLALQLRDWFWNRSSFLGSLSAAPRRLNELNRVG